MRLIYRYSPNESIGKPKIVGKQECLLSFAKAFSPYISEVHLVIDSGLKGTVTPAEEVFNEWFNGVTVHYKTCDSSTSSSLSALDVALQFEGHEIVYLAEDDYLYAEDSYQLFEEGLRVFDYVTLYDHPDKYMSASPNPYVTPNKFGAGAEQTRVYLTKSSHWKETNSTTMTFAARVQTLRADQFTLRKHCVGNLPHDFAMFLELGQAGRILGSPLPGRATHAESAFLAPLVDWKNQ